MKNLKAAVAVMMVAAPVWMAAQETGVSHPEAIPAEQPVYTSGSTTVGTPGLKPRATVPMPAATAATTTTNVDGAIVEGPAYVAPVAAAPVAASAGLPAGMPRARAFDPDAGVVGDEDANVVTRVAGPANQLPAGTMMKTRLEQELSTRETRDGAAFTASLLEPVMRDGQVLLPAGSVLRGRVTDVQGGSRWRGGASLRLTPLNVTLPDGTEYAVQGQVIDTGMHRQTKVDKEGTISRKSQAKGTVAAFTLGTGGAAAAGAVIGGLPGALIGAGIGAGVTTAVWLRQDRQANLPAQTEVTFALTAPMRVGS